MLEVRDVQPEDLEVIRHLRNESRFAFFTTDLISPADMQEWFERFEGRMKVLVIRGEVIGSFTLEEYEDGIEVGRLLLSHENRGHGYMTQAIKETLSAYSCTAYARILTTNEPSLRLFRRLNFQDDKVDGSVIQLALRPPAP